MIIITIYNLATTSPRTSGTGRPNHNSNYTNDSSVDNNNCNDDNIDNT